MEDILEFIRFNLFRDGDDINCANTAENAFVNNVGGYNYSVTDRSVGVQIVGLRKK